VIERSIVLATLMALGFGLVWLWERRPLLGRESDVAGLTLVTGPDCALCPQARSALERAGVPHRVVDVSDSAGLGVRSLPTLLSIDPTGVVEWRRSGRAALHEVARLAGEMA
jgi:hypothetical protein